jgi:hypothetical protein
LAAILAMVVGAHCGDGGSAVLTPTPDAPPSPDALPMIACDVTKQDCAAPYSKCTVVGRYLTLASQPERQELCVPPSGSKALNENCTRTDPTWLSSTVADADDCAPGLYCTIFGSISPPSCKKLCHGDNECGPGESCLIILHSRQKSGLCLPKCDLYGTTCGSGLTCDETDQGFDIFLSEPLTCRAVGNVAMGGTCSSRLDCAANATCVFNKFQIAPPRKCFAICDSYQGGSGLHPCATGTCVTDSRDTPSIVNQPGWGTCQ